MPCALASASPSRWNKWIARSFTAGAKALLPIISRISVSPRVWP